MHGKEQTVLCQVTEHDASLTLPAYRERCCTYPMRETSSLQHLVREQHATISHQFVFDTHRGDLPSRADDSANEGPAHWLYRRNAQALPSENPSVQVMTIAGVETHPVLLKGKKVGICYEDEYARYGRLSGVLPSDLTASRPEQAGSVLEGLAQALEHCGLRFSDTVRTWFYLDRLLDWYAEFNRVRTDFFSRMGLFDLRVPASTGIGIANASGAALTAGLLAIRPKDNRVTIRAVDSPLQCSALQYQSSFSRAIEVLYPTHGFLMISGTASIDANGKSAHPGDPVQQIELTMQVVEALLQVRGMTWQDAFRGIVYYTDMNCHRHFSDYCARHGIPRFPMAVSCADICRHELLFEIEIDAIQLR